jgi:hypothetical protein
VSKRWSKSETALLREHYASKGPAWCAAQLKDRSAGSIKEKASRLGVRRDHFKTWSFGPALEELYMLGFSAPDIAKTLGCEKRQVDSYVRYFSITEARRWQRKQQAKEILERHGLLKAEEKAA